VWRIRNDRPHDSYSYDPGSRLTAETLNGSTTSYQYDADNQLTQGGTLTYGYDANGNRNNTGYTTGTGNQLTNDGTWTYTYDGEGNLTKKSKGSLLETWTYGYDNLNHLVWAEDRQSDRGSLITRMDYKYDVLGNRIDLEVTANSVTTATHFAYDGENAWADLSGTNALQMRRLYTDATDALFARIDSGGTVAWYLTDRLGSVRDIANNTTGVSIDHIDYDGFGNATETQSSNGDRYKYTAREWDAVMRLQYSRGRYYDPATGRWTSEDPLGFNAGDSNLYRYVGNNSVNSVDPSGLEPIQAPLKVDRGTLNWGTYTDAVTGVRNGFMISFTRPGFVNEWKKDAKLFKVKQWLQLEVYAVYQYDSKNDNGVRCFDEFEALLPPGKDLEPPSEPGDKPHGHSHVSASPFKPTLQPDNGDSKDAFSVGPYAPQGESKDTVQYWDNPDTPAAVFPQAVRQVRKQWPKRTIKNRQNELVEACLVKVRVVERFVTIVYLGETNPVATVHWTSTSEGSPDEQPSPPKTEEIGAFPGYKEPTKVVAEWKNGPDPRQPTKDDLW
jgi:RHS repeat-associated protein